MADVDGRPPAGTGAVQDAKPVGRPATIEKATKPRARKGDGTIFTAKDGRHRAASTVPDAVTSRPVRRDLSAWAAVHEGTPEGPSSLARRDAP